MAKPIVSRRPSTSSQFEKADSAPSNVTLALSVNERWFPCPVCQAPLQVRTSKKSKPYVICVPCGVQMFVRGREGIRRSGLMVSGGGVGSSMRLGRLLEVYEDLMRRLEELKKLRALHGDDSALKEEERLLTTQRRKSRENLISALREKKRELETHGRRRT